MSERKPYPSDLSDGQWSLIEPVITAWKDRHRSVSGHQGAYAMREIVNAILYQGRTGCQWAYLPHDLPPKSVTYYYFAAWRDDGTDQVIHELLRCQVRERARRLEDPTLVVLDTQRVHAAAGVPAATTGQDPAKKVPGRKRGLAVDVLGLVIAVIVLAASTHDNAAGVALLDQVAERTGGTVEKALADQGFKKQVVAHGAGLGIDVEIVVRNPKNCTAGCRRQRPTSNTSRSRGRPSPPSPTGSRPTHRTCPSTRTTPASSVSSTTRPDHFGPGRCAKPSTTNCCRRTSKVPAPSSNVWSSSTSSPRSTSAASPGSSSRQEPRRAAPHPASSVSRSLLCLFLRTARR
ncbi:IS5 family transposase [Streptomyces bambusae]|uniref:IS5 family transposase n=1 Tax=Streptomyces bambusae TaxID=1550616 RepID=UPI0035ABC94A